MTEKRFEIIENSKNYLRVDDKTKKMFYLNEKEVVNLLNVLSDENEQLKQQIESYKKVIEDCDNLFCKYGVDTSNLRAVEELFKTLDSDGVVE